MTLTGTTANPLRVAIIGSGPSGFYAADAYLKQTDLTVYVDMFERLPTPHGLVRGGVAPDHAKIKTVTKQYDKIAAHPHFRFFGSVELGRDITHDDLTAHYHQVVYATGAQTDRQLGIPGETLPNSHPATAFVGWYNAHPDYRDLSFDLSQERVAVIGNGNVAMDVVRILASSYEELARTDIADYALEALKHSRVREIYILGRRGPGQAAFTNPEIKELGALTDADVIVPPEEAALDELSRAWIAVNNDKVARGNVEMLQKYSAQPPAGRPKRIHFRFLVSPTALVGDERVEAIQLVKNVLVKKDDGSLSPRATDQAETIPVGLVFRSIGYKGVPLPGVPFDAKSGVIPNQQGRVFDPATGAPRPGEYAAGWIKRGPSGIIGTNRPDSVETVDSALADMRDGRTLQPANAAADAMPDLLRARGVDYVTYQDWLNLDAAEQERGREINRPRLKFSRVDEMLDVVRAMRTVSDPAMD
ncbi:MAG: FAD-dependent oxidoreductase [bacterium]|nr:FAD-dependent oxidoreductase [bacterium]